MRVGLHSAVVWKRLYLRPLSASRSSVGMRIGPPKALLAPKPMSSISTMTTFGAPCGAFTSKRGGGVASRASSVVIGAAFGSAIGSTVRSIGYGSLLCAGRGDRRGHGEADGDEVGADFHGASDSMVDRPAF